MELVGQGQVITTTAEHPFYVAGEERFVPAGELTLNDSLVDSQGFPVAIEAIRPAPHHNIVHFCVRELGTRSETYHGGALTGVCAARTWFG
jgi:hypothetical protein